MSVIAAAMTTGSNLKHVGMVIGGCNLVGFIASAGLETHKITDLVGVGSFVAAALSLSLRNPAVFNRMKVIPFVAESGVLGRLSQLGELNINFGTARVLIANGIVIIWGARLSTYLFHRVLKLGEDKRLDKFYKQPGESYLDSTKSLFPLKLSGFWLIQAAWGFLCCLPITLLNSVSATPAVGALARSTVMDLLSRKAIPALPLSMHYTGPISLLKWLPVAAAVGGVVLETMADHQKTSFRSNPVNKLKWCDKGVWSLCRYPNYLGEMMTWWGLYGLCAPALTLPLAIVSLISPVFVTFLLLKVSGIPLLEAANEKKYAENKEYAQYRNETPLLIPSMRTMRNFFFRPEKKE